MAGLDRVSPAPTEKSPYETPDTLVGGSMSMGVSGRGQRSSPASFIF